MNADGGKRGGYGGKRRLLHAAGKRFRNDEAQPAEGKGKAGDWKWKRRKGEQMKCHICGESGHFTQGCPTTLGVNKKVGEVVEVQNAVSSGSNVGKDVGDKLQDELKEQSVRRPQGPYANATGKPPVAAQKTHSPAPKPQRNFNFHKGRASHPGARQNPSHMEPRRHWEPAPNGRAPHGPSKFMHSAIPFKDHAAYHDGSKDRPSYPSHGRGFSVLQPRMDPHIMHEPRPLPQPMEEMEQIFSEEAMEISKQQAADVDRENDRHREQMRMIQEYYHQKSIQLKSKHEEQVKVFLQHEGQSQQQYQLQTSQNHFVSSSGGPPPFPTPNWHGNSSSSEQYDMNAIQNVQGHEAAYDSYQNPSQYYINSVQANHRKQVFETSIPRSNQNYTNDPHARGSPFTRHMAEK